MNRREFLRNIIVGVIGINAIALVNEDKIIEETNHLSDDNFVTYITLSINLYVHNPAYCGIITNIALPE